MQISYSISSIWRSSMKEMMSYEEYLVEVKKGIVTDQGNCPVTPLLQKLQGKWKSQILYELCILNPARFGQIKRIFRA